MDGNRDQRVSVQNMTGTETSFGTRANTWTEAYRRWAKVKGVKGAESTVEGVPVYAGTYKFHFAKPTAITPAQRIVWNGRNFNIVAIDDSPRDEVIVTAVDGQQREA